MNATKSTNSSSPKEIEEKDKGLTDKLTDTDLAEVEEKSNLVKIPTSDEKELIEALEGKDFEKLELLEDEEDGFSEERARRLFQLWRAKEISTLDEAVKAAESVDKKFPQLLISLNKSIFSLEISVDASITKFLQLLKLSSRTPSFRNSGAGSESENNSKVDSTVISANAGKFPAGTQFDILRFYKVTLDVRKSVPHLNVSKQIKELLVYSETAKQTVYSLKNCENISLPLTRNSYVVVVDGYQCGLFFK